MKALIIGGTGFVGKYLAEEIRKSLNCEVIITTTHLKSDRESPYRIIHLDIVDEKEVNAVLYRENPDYIFLLAAQSSVALSWKEPVETINVNVKGTLNVLNAIRLLNQRTKILIVGSGEEYGYVESNNIPISEVTETKPGNVYAVSKVMQNQMATIFARAYGIDLIITRSFNHVGPGQTDRFVISDFCHQVAKIEKGIQEPIIRVGNLHARRDFTDVRDVANAYVRLVLFGKRQEVYNVGSGKAVSIEKILESIIKMSQYNISVEIDQNKFRPVDVPIIKANISKIYRDTGWKPQIDLEQTLRDTLLYWRNKEE